MTTALERYRLWAEHPYFDEATRAELKSFAHDPADVEERFNRGLEFGTGGLRGVMAAGTNRMNRYVVRQATQGLACYISTFGESARNRGVVISYDSRHLSREFALDAALTLNANGVVAYLWDTLRPTPMLSYAVRTLRAIAGINITASHNPKEYNGYKVYWEDGGQIPPQRTAVIFHCIESIPDITAILPMAEADARAAKLLRPVPMAVDDSYYDRIVGLAVTEPAERAACRILYTPLHGTGNVPVQRACRQAGFPISAVREQEWPDPEFSTVVSPNPEDPAVFTLALKQAQFDKPDVILATDPDADRLGVQAKNADGQFRQLSGNQIGAILTDYLLRSRPLPSNGAVVKSIATSNLIAPLCREHGVALVQTHTGFKFIGDKIREFEETGSHTFLLGFEESYGYLGATFVRDKDAVMGALLMADAVTYYKARGLTLCDALEEIWRRCGYFQEETYDVKLGGQQGKAKIGALIDGLRYDPPNQFADTPVAFTEDYASGIGIDHVQGIRYTLALGEANVLHYRFEDGGFVMVRPSGTEPKLKLYFSMNGKSERDSRQRLQAVKAATLKRMGLAYM